MQDLGTRARAASRLVAKADSATKNKALTLTAEAIERDCARLLEANAQDVAAARAATLDSAAIDRLTLTEKTVAAMADGLRQIARLDDPIGAVSELQERPSGIKVGRMRVPLGVIAIIYESRPNVTADAAGLCLKSGNACILRGGSESIHSNQAIALCVQEGLRGAGLPEDAVQVVNTTDRAAVGALLRMNDCIDIVVPRGGKSLIERVMAESRIPMIKHLDGICHVYIDDTADFDKAIRIADNAKTQRLGTCNTMETLLVARAIAADILPTLATVYQAKGIELRGDEAARRIVPAMKAATEEDWRTEYLDAILSIRVVDGLEQAIEHIATYSSQHTDAIVTEDAAAAATFLNSVDSAVAMWNASTQFCDGGEFGFGAEIGIATGRMHARGPIGLEQLTTFRYLVRGTGQIRP